MNLKHNLETETDWETCPNNFHHFYFSSSSPKRKDEKRLMIATPFANKFLERIRLEDNCWIYDLVEGKKRIIRKELFKVDAYSIMFECANWFERKKSFLNRYLEYSESIMIIIQSDGAHSFTRCSEFNFSTM